MAKSRGTRSAGRIRVGVGGWTYEPWRETFYPAGLPASRELQYAGQHLTSIEINGTFYRSQGPKSFAKWRDETPDDFVFAVKGHRAVVNKKALGDSGEAIGWFLNSGLTELGAKLGPILWQFTPYRKFDPGDIEAFLLLLPHELNGLRLRHALEVRSSTFVVPEFVDLARRHGVAIVFAESDEHPALADPTADFIYVRLQRSQAEEEMGYPSADLDRWSASARTWQSGGVPEGLPVVTQGKPNAAGRDVFLYFISGAKERNPAAAQALIARLGSPA